MSSSPPKETDGKPPAKKDPPPAAAAANKESGDKDAPAAAAAAAEQEKPKEPEKVKLLASKTLLLRRALECPNGGTAEDRPTPGVPIAASAASAASKTKGGPIPNPVTTTATFPVQNMPPLEMPLPNIPHTEMYSQNFAAFQQQQQQQFFSAQAYQRKLALEMHEAALKEAAAEKKEKELAAKRAATAAKKKRGRPKKTAIADADGVVGSPGAKAAPSDPGTPGVKRELLWEGTPPEEIEGGWPEGWLKKTFRRMGGSSAGTQDSYWVTPIKAYKLRSMREVKDFIAALEENGGDEIAAKKASKPPSRKKQKVDGDSMEVEAEVVQGGGVMDAVAEAVQDI